MGYFHLVGYFLVILWIQDNVAFDSKTKFSIWANTTTVSPGEVYTITCQSDSYSNVWLRKNTQRIVERINSKCSFASNDYRRDYQCSIEPSGSSSQFRFSIKIAVLNGENNQTTVQWDCVHAKDNRIVSKILNITFEIPETTTPISPSPTKQNTPLSSPGQSKPSTSTPISTKSSISSRKSTTSTKLPPSGNKSANMNTSNGSKNAFHFNINLIAICCAVGVLVLFITILTVMYLRNKRKRDQVKSGPVRPIAQDPSGFPTECNYDVVESQSPPKYNWSMDDEDLGNAFDAAESEDVAETVNPNFDASKVYGVINKQKSVPDSKNSYGEDDPVPSNPKFDPDKVYGVVDKPAKSHYPVFDSTPENVYANQ